MGWVREIGRRETRNALRVAKDIKNDLLYQLNNLFDDTPTPTPGDGIAEIAKGLHGLFTDYLIDRERLIEAVDVLYGQFRDDMRSATSIRHNVIHSAASPFGDNTWQVSRFIMEKVINVETGAYMYQEFQSLYALLAGAFTEALYKDHKQPEEVEARKLPIKAIYFGLPEQITKENLCNYWEKGRELGTRYLERQSIKIG